MERGDTTGDLVRIRIEGARSERLACSRSQVSGLLVKLIIYAKNSDFLISSVQSFVFADGVLITQ